MPILANILIGGALFVVLITLILGMFAMMDKSPEARLRSNKLMRYRVMAQAVAVGVFFVAVIMKKAGG